MFQALQVFRFENSAVTGARTDAVAVEAPLEIRVEGHMVAVAMRTLGHDRELAAGWALSEGIVQARDEIADVVLRPGDPAERGAMADVMLANPGSFDLDKHRRNILTNASCGLCGAGSIEQILRNYPKITSPFQIDAPPLVRLSHQMRGAQSLFRRTGGVHACAVFDENGVLLAAREDVGRHNALDKLNGWALLEGHLPLSHHVLFLSGRVSLEMVQKAVCAGIPLIAAIGAPSSLAVDLARESGQCLVGFLRGESFNVYAGIERIRGAGGL